jgi:Protein of unknown function (DUF3261)
VRALIASVAALAAGCASTPDAAPRARLAEHLALTLPLPPGYPEARTIAQSLSAHYGALDGAFESVLVLSPEQVEIIVTAAGGPRLATITWNAEGVHEEETPLVPNGVPVENLLADIFVTQWPAEAVAAALPDGATLALEADGARVVRQGEATIIEVRPDPADASRVFVRNHAFGYELTIVSRVLE